MQGHQILAIDPTTYAPHALHQGERAWLETNCFVDLWIELLHAHGCDPTAALPFTVALDLEGDQFTFFKFPFRDLELLYGVDVIELNIWHSLVDHVAAEVRRGRPVVVELDSYYLPDTKGTAYRQEHVKTSVAVNQIDVAGKTLGYFHNAGYYTLAGDDFAGVFRLDRSQFDASHLPPYVEVVRQERLRRIAPTDLVAASRELLRHHLALRPANNPFAAYRDRFPSDLQWVEGHGMAGFHAYAFATLRQAGANFELCRDYLQWLGTHADLDTKAAQSHAEILATTPKTLQFKLARAVAGKRAFDASPLLAAMADAWDALQVALEPLA